MGRASGGVIHSLASMWIYQAVQREIGDLSDMSAARKAVSVYREAQSFEKRFAVAAVIIGMAKRAAATAEFTSCARS